MIKQLLFLSFFIWTSFYSKSQPPTIQLNTSSTLRGKVKKVIYETPTGDLNSTYILRLNKMAKVKIDNQIIKVDEVHLNILNPYIAHFNLQHIQVKGLLFKALNLHHRRTVCIRVDQIRDRKNNIIWNKNIAE